MTLSIELSADEEARLTAAARQEGIEPEALIHKLVANYLPAGGVGVAESKVIDRSKPPFRQDPRLVGVQFHEDPVAGVDPDAWPEAFEK